MHRTTLERLTNLINDPPAAFAHPRASLPRTINNFKASRSDLKEGLRIAHKARTSAYLDEQRARTIKSTRLHDHFNDHPAELADDIARNDQGIKAAIIKCVLSRWASEDALKRLKMGEGDDLGYAEDLNRAKERAHRCAYPNGEGESNPDTQWQATLPSPTEEEI